MTDRPTVLHKDEARQAQSGLGVRNVLVISLALIVLALVVVYFIAR